MTKSIKLSLDTTASVAAYTGQAIKTDKVRTRAIDSLIADGVTSVMLKAPAKDADATLYNAVKEAVILGFSNAVHVLLSKDTKTLSDAQKTDKRYWQMQIGSKLGDLRSALSRREAKEEVAAEGEEGKASNAASMEARLKKELCAWIVRIEKAEATQFSVVDMLKYLKSASALIK